MKEDDFNPIRELLTILADGEVQSGKVLAKELGISRAAVWKRIKKLSELGIEFVSIKSKGYRLVAPIYFLDANIIQETIKQTIPNKKIDVTVVQQTDSTNSSLLSQARQWPHRTTINCLLAEHQTAGRGRRGKQWHSPFGQNIYLSILWSTEVSLNELEGLSLAVGASIAKVLRDEYGIQPELKWPNDIHVSGAKIGGVLIDVDGSFDGPLNVVIGIGLNVNLKKPPDTMSTYRWASMSDFISKGVSRNHVASTVISSIVHALEIFEKEGFRPFRNSWCEFDALNGQEVEVCGPQKTVYGTARGVDESGALILDAADRTEICYSGEVSVRIKK